MGNIGTFEILIVLGVVLLLFGSTQLPKLARSVGQAQKEFKQGLKDGAADDEGEEKPAK
jgi:sec-independent protein translocase protein TatA